MENQLPPDKTAIPETELERLKEDFEAFAYTVSHDLREPVRMVRSFMELLEKKYAGQLDEKAASYIHYALDGARRLDQMIQDLLVFYRAARTGPQEAFSFGEVLQSVEKLLLKDHPSFKIQHSHLSVDKITGDKAAWTQLFHFIIADVFIFFPAGLPNIVAISNVEENGELRTTITAAGVKQDPRMVETSFKLFNKAGAENGNGYRKGWAVARRVIESWKGSMQAAITEQQLVITILVPL